MKIREGARQTMAWLHGWVGLLLGWVLFVIALAGTMSVFRNELGNWLHPEAVVAADVAPTAALTASADWLRQHAPKSHGWYIVAPGPRTPVPEATWQDGETWQTRAMDPVTGAPLPRQTLAGEFFYRLHFELELPYPWGRLLASLAAALMLAAIISGIVAHRRFFRDIFTFRPGHGQRAWLDGHNALGVLALPFHIMITLTGLVTLASLNMPWAIAANYGADLAAAYADLSPGATEREEAGRPGTIAPIAPMLATAERRFGAPIGRIGVNHPYDADATVNVFRTDADRFVTGGAAMTFDGATGRVLAANVEARPAVVTYGVIYGLHMARFASPLLRWLYFIGGLALTMVIASGLVLWIVKRRERAPLSWGNRVAERLNVGVIAGTPIGFAAFFWANRSLALELPGRAEAEVSITLWTWGAAVLAGVVLPPRIGWRALLTIGGIAWVLLPVVGPSPALPLILPIDAVLAMTGAALLWCAARRKPVAAVRRRAPRMAAA